jgi:hypothetical protein
MNNQVAEVALRLNSACDQSEERPPALTFRLAEPHLVYMSFVRLADGWHCRFHNNDPLRSPVSRRLVFRRSEKIYEAARRGNGLIDEESRQILAEAVALGRGGIWLRLTEDQYSALAMFKPRNFGQN